MLKKDFWYDLPKELIAQEPADPRDSARLMVLSQKDDSIQHKIFHDLPEFLEPGDLLVVNNSKVLPARIVGVKQPTGAVCELLLLRQVKGDQWECLAKPGKRMQPGTKVSFGDGSLTAVVDETMEDGNKYVTFYYDTETLYEKLDEFGKMPLPPYITKQLEDQCQYQTVYAKELGSAAAPTAGLILEFQNKSVMRRLKRHITFEFYRRDIYANFLTHFRRPYQPAFTPARRCSAVLAIYRPQKKQVKKDNETLIRSGQYWRNICGHDLIPMRSQSIVSVCFIKIALSNEKVLTRM